MEPPTTKSADNPLFQTRCSLTKKGNQISGRSEVNVRVRDQVQNHHGFVSSSIRFQLKNRRKDKGRESSESMRIRTSSQIHDNVEGSRPEKDA